mmetsp:Transcript_33565/g.44311  ORF Transcript_33565/g.44311 Transcript_33565/m.44311 type:complete len:348 (-) Transcript_33565:483-1526(-)
MLALARLQNASHAPSRLLPISRFLQVQKAHFQLGSTGGRFEQWPVTQTNTVINVCPQGHKIVIERFGKLSSVQDPGLFFAVPMIDSLSYVVDIRERAVEISPQKCITKDNVSVDVSGNVYIQFTDPEKAAYGSRDPLYAVRQHAQSAMRAAIGEMELDDILHARAKLNAIIKGAVQEAATAWGLEIKRYEITEITPDKFISEAMDKQAAAERTRRERVLNAEGEKRSQQLESEGVKLKLINESEGRLQQVRNEATAMREKLILEAEGEATAIKARAQASAEAIIEIAKAISKEEGVTAAQMEVAKEYIKMYGEMAKQSNTMVFSDKPADINNLMAQAASVLKAAATK